MPGKKSRFKDCWTCTKKQFSLGLITQEPVLHRHYPFLTTAYRPGPPCSSQDEVCAILCQTPGTPHPQLFSALSTFPTGVPSGDFVPSVHVFPASDVGDTEVRGHDLFARGAPHPCGGKIKTSVRLKDSSMLFRRLAEKIVIQCYSI